jgi:hypothetical protein
MADGLDEYGFEYQHVSESDINPRNSRILKRNTLSNPCLDYHDLVMSNPPYSLSDAFVSEYVPRNRQTLFLMRLSWCQSIKPRDEYGGKSRSEWLRYTRPSVYVLPSRPSFTNNGKTDKFTHAWYHWSNDPLAQGKFEILKENPRRKMRNE